MNVTILTESELRRTVVIDDEVLAAVEDGFTRLARGQATMPPIMRVDIPEYEGEVDVKSAYLQGLDSFAVKLSSGFFNNYLLGLPSASGLMILISAKTGVPQALLLDNGYLTDVRTGAAGAIAAKYLARQQVETAGVIGAGAQARYQMRALKQVRDFRRLLVYSRSAASMAQYQADMEPELGVEVVQAKDAETVVRESQVVVTTTPAKQPYLQAGWLQPGQHITAMGSDAEEKQELHPAVLARADILVCDRKSQAFRLGELRSGLAAGLLAEDGPVLELGELTAGQKPGRTDDSQITVCDLTGTGVQDTAIALLAYRRALTAGLGQVIEG